MLDERIERNSVDPAKIPEHRQICAHAPNAQAVLRHQETEDGHANGPHRNQPGFDFSTRKITRRETPDSYPYAHRSLQIADLRFVHAQTVMPVNDNYKLEQRGKKPQVRVAHHRPSQYPIFGDNAKLSAEIGERIGPESPRQVSGGGSRYFKAPSQSA